MDIHTQLDALAALKLPPPRLRQQLTGLRGEPVAIGLFAVEHGVFDLAHAHLSTALQREPTRCELAIGLARAKAGLGDLKGAFALIDMAVQLHPTAREAARWCIQLRAEAGHLPAAARRATTLLQQQPTNAVAWRAAAPVFAQLGESTMALQAWQRAVELEPSHRWSWFHLGNQLIGQGAFGRAVEALRQADALGEPHAAILTNLGTALAHAGKLGLARRTLQRAVTADPEALPARLMLAQLLASCSQEDAADAAFADALALAPDSPRVLVRYADFLIGAGRGELAETHLRRVLAQAPDHEGARLALGRLHTRRGEHAEAVAQLGPLMRPELEAANTICAFARSCIRTGQPARAVALLQGRAARRCTPTQSQQLHHTLGDLHAALGDFDAAFEAHQTGNRHREQDIDPARVVADFREIARALSAPPPTRGGPGEGVVFIVGMLRSGTSLTEQILASHPRVAPGGELPTLSATLRPLARGDRSPGAWARALAELSTEDCHALGAAYIADATRRAGTTPDALGPLLLTDKQPTNFMMLGAIARILPKARIVHCRRNALDTCLSCFFQNLGAGHAYTTELSWMGQVYRAYRQQMAWWIERCGLRVTELDYESLVDDTEAQVRRLLEAVGLPFDPACLAFHTNRRDVRTASVDQVRRPIYRSSVGRAERYARWLSPLHEALGTLDALPPLLEDPPPADSSG